MSGFARKFSRIEGSFSQERRLPRLGKIRLGIKKVSAKGVEYPVETSYFVVPPEVEAIYGPQSTELDVMLPLDDPTIIFPQRLVWYGKGKGVKCTGNGVEADRYDEVKKDWFGMKCPCEMLKTDANPKGECTEQADLMVILHKVNVGGVYQVTTRSYNSVVDINSGLDYTRALIGRIVLVPLKLRRVERTTHYDDPDKGRVSRKHYTLTIGLDATPEGINLLRESTTRVIENARRLAVQLPAPVMESPAADPPDETDTIEPETNGGTAQHEPEAGYGIGSKQGDLVPMKRYDEPTHAGGGSTPPEPGGQQGNVEGRSIPEERGGATAARQAHTLEAGGSIPLPATIPTQQPLIDTTDVEIGLMVEVLQATETGKMVLKGILRNYGLGLSTDRPKTPEACVTYLEELREQVDRQKKVPP